MRYPTTSYDSWGPESPFLLNIPILDEDTCLTRFFTTIAKTPFFIRNLRNVVHRICNSFLVDHERVSDHRTPPCTLTVLFMEHTHKRKLTLRQVAVRPSRHPPTLFPIHLHHPGTHQRFLSNLTFSKLFDSDLQVSSTPLPPPQFSYNYNHNPFLITPLRHIILPFSSYTEFFPATFFVLKIIHRNPALSGAIFLGFLTGGSFGKLT